MNDGASPRTDGANQSGVEHVDQEADQRLALAPLVLPACTMRTMELTIIERASPGSERSRNSDAITRSAAVKLPEASVLG